MVAKFGISETGNEARADDTDQGERLGGVHAVLYPPAIAVLKRGEGGGAGFGIKDGIKQVGRKGKVLVRQRIIAGLDPSRPSHLILLVDSPLSLPHSERRIPLPVKRR